MSRTHQLERPAEPITVNYLRTTDTSPELTGEIESPTAPVTVTVNGVTYPATNNGDGTWTLAPGTISPTLAPDSYEVEAEADINGATVSDGSTSELTVFIEFGRLLRNGNGLMFRNGEGMLLRRTV